MENFYLPNRILIARRESNLTQEDLAQKIGISRVSVLNYESGKRKVPADVLYKIAEAVGKPLSFFHPPQGLNQESASNVIQINVILTKVPVITWSQANNFSLAGYQEIASASAQHVFTTTKGSHMFALTISGNSMEPEFRENDIIVVNPELKPQNSDFILARNSKATEALFTQLRIYGDKNILHPLNPEFPDLELNDDGQYSIIGVVTDKIKQYRR